MDKDQIYKTDFGEQLAKDAVALATHLIDEREKLKKKRPVLSHEEEYIDRVRSSFTEVIDLLDNLEYAEIFLNSYAVSTAWKKKYDRSHYIRYHYEAWVLNIVRLYERLLILVDDVYVLNIPHKDVTYKKTAESPKLSDTRTLEILNKIHGVLNPTQGLKNELFHRYVYTDKSLAEIASFDFVARHSKQNEDKDKFMFASKLKAKFYLDNKKAEVRRNNKKMLEIVIAIFRTLNDAYEQGKTGSRAL